MSPQPDLASTTDDAESPVDGRRARAERNRDAVVEAILELLSSGVEQPSVTEIAERSGVSVRSVFRHFEDVESLHLAAIIRQWERVGPLFGLDVPEGSTATRVAALVNQRARLFEEIANVRRSAVRLAPTSRAITRNLRESQRILRGEVAECFAVEVADRPQTERDDLLDGLELAASWAAWSTLRTEQRLPVVRAQRVVELTLLSLLT
jgi:TetR/AcrR family transcriptional regulator of autoinduction and epiphytic fitness